MASTYTAIPDLAAEVAIPATGFLSQTIFNDDHVKVILFGFAPGQELAAHTAPMPATIQLLQGEATITLGDDSIEACAGFFVHMQPNLRHGIRARSPLRMLLTLIKAARADADR